MNIKRSIAALVVAGAAVTGGLALSTPASAATGTWIYYNQYSGTGPLSWTACESGGARMYHTWWKWGPNWWQVGYVQNWDCYWAYTHIDLELNVS